MSASKKQPTQLQSTPAESPCNLFYLRRAARAVSRKYNALLQETGLHETQFSVLFIASRTGPISITQLANRLGLQRTSLSRTLNPLVTAAYITVSDEGYRRTRIVEVTQTGMQKLSEALPLWNQAQAFYRQALGQENVDTLIALLGKMNDAGLSD